MNTRQRSVGSNVTVTGVSFAGTVSAAAVPEAGEWAMLVVAAGIGAWYGRRGGLP